LTYKIELESRAKRDFLNLTNQVADRIGVILDDLRNDPRPPGAKKLTGQNGYRVRKGDYRILYTIEEREKRVRVYRIGHRRDIYRR
jgi:mRNA interferase RelE/StbE